MAYDEGTVERIRDYLGEEPNITEKNMFGGVAFLLNGNMCCGVNKDDIVLRVGNDMAAEIVEEDHVRPCDFTGRIIKSMVMIDPDGYESDAALHRWVDISLEFNRGLPPK